MKKTEGGMENFDGRIAVVTGGGTGMGRELVRHLAMAGCHVATCDVSATTLNETRSLALETAPAGTRVTTSVADVADESQLLAFRDAVVKEHATTSINLLFNNAGVAGAGSFVDDDRAAWERTFAIDWGGVYLGTRTFLGMLVTADEGHVKVRQQLAADGTPVDEVSDEDLRKGVAMFGEAFRDLASLTAASAAQIILEGVRQNKWRILVGEDAVIVDQMVRDDPENAYEPEFWHTLQSRGLFGGFG